MVSRAQQMSTDPKQVLDDAVNGREALQLDGRLEAAHLALPSRTGGIIDTVLSTVHGLRLERRVSWCETSARLLEYWSVT